MNDITERERHARVRLSLIAGPSDPVVGYLLHHHGAAWDAWQVIRSGDNVTPPQDANPRAFTTRLGTLRRRAGQLSELAPTEAQRRAAAVNARLVLPETPEWPSRLASLGPAQPYLLWVRGLGDLRNACLRSVAVVGARAATDYGMHVATDVSFGLAERGWTTVSGGAFGIDAQAHRGALTAGGGTVAVLACGPDVAYPRGHASLFDEIARGSVLVSELPPGKSPRRHSFLVRNRLIAALTAGTVVVEAGGRSGAMNTARHAESLHRPLMAVPGPVTSALSVGCHQLLRDWNAMCVTSASDIIEHVGELATDVVPAGRPRADLTVLDAATQELLAQLHGRQGTEPAALAQRVGWDMPTLLRELGLLAAAGLVERTNTGWRRTE